MKFTLFFYTEIENKQNKNIGYEKVAAKNKDSQDFVIDLCITCGEKTSTTVVERLRQSNIFAKQRFHFQTYQKTHFTIHFTMNSS